MALSASISCDQKHICPALSTSEKVELTIGFASLQIFSMVYLGLLEKSAQKLYFVNNAAANMAMEHMGLCLYHISKDHMRRIAGQCRIALALCHTLLSNHLQGNYLYS